MEIAKGRNCFPWQQEIKWKQILRGRKGHIGYYHELPGIMGKCRLSIHCTACVWRTYMCVCGRLIVSTVPLSQEHTSGKTDSTSSSASVGPRKPWRHTKKAVNERGERGGNNGGGSNNEHTPMNLALMHLIDSHIHILKTREHRIQGYSLCKQEKMRHRIHS